MMLGAGQLGGRRDTAAEFGLLDVVSILYAHRKGNINQHKHKYQD